MFRHSFIIGFTLSCILFTHSSGIRYKGEEIPFRVVFQHIVNKFKQYSFDKVLDAGMAGPRVIFNTDGAIISISDGLPIPIYVSSIPQSVRHLNKLRTDANLSSDALIGLYTLNTSDEQDHYNLTATVAKDGFTHQHQYPTIDFTAPSMRDLIQGVCDLSTRDMRQEELTCIHCKAGIGRSVTLAAAYLLYIYSIASKQYPDGTCVVENFDDTTTVAMIIEYIKTKRSVAHPNIEQRAAVKEFYTALRTAGSLENLYQQIALNTLF